MDGRIDENGSNRIVILDILKFSCIVMVIVTHYEWTDEQRRQLLFPYWIDMAVPVFMLISGYLGAMSFERHKIDDIKKSYNRYFILAKVLRYAIPFSVVFIVEVIADFFIKSIINTEWNCAFQPSVAGLIKFYINGGAGPGSYYFPVMLQFVFLFPGIYFAVRKKKAYGVVLFFVLNLLYEGLKFPYMIGDELYRQLIFRYIFIISVGIFFYYVNKNREIKNAKKILLFSTLSFCIGCIYVYIVSYTSYVEKIATMWTGTFMLVGFYVGPLVYLILYMSNRIQYKETILLKFIVLCGKASFDIFLTQMVFYRYASLFWNAVIPAFHCAKKYILPANLAMCIGIGTAFYVMENSFTKRLVLWCQKRTERTF